MTTSDTIPVEEGTMPSIPGDRPKTSADRAADARYSLSEGRVPVSLMNCSVCGHPASLHEAMQGPCHQGEGVRDRCECTSFGGGEWKPADHGTLGAMPGRPMSKVTPLEPGTPPPTGPTKHTQAIEDEGAARLALRAAQEERERQADEIVDGDAKRRREREEVEARRGLGTDRRAAIELALREYVNASHPAGGLDCAANREGLHCCLDPEHPGFRSLVDFLDRKLTAVVTVARVYDRQGQQVAEVAGNAPPLAGSLRGLPSVDQPDFEPGDIVALKSTLNDGHEMTVNAVIDGKVDVRFFDDMGYQRDLIAAGALRRVPPKGTKPGRR